MYQSKKFIGHQEVREGLRIVGHATQGRVSFTVAAACASVHPEIWHGEVTFGGLVLMTTGPAPGHVQATRAAEAMLASKVVELFCESR